jgi:transposase
MSVTGVRREATAAVSARIATLGNDYVRARGGSLSRHRQCLDLTDDLRTRCFDAREIGSGIAKGQHDRDWPRPTRRQPERPIDGGMATEALVAHVVTSKYCDHTPLYRHTQILARQGVTLDRSTLCDWVGRACWWLAPLHELMLSTVLSSPVVFADDTTLPVLDPGRGRTKTGRLWCYAVDNRDWNGPGHPAVAYVFSEDRKGAHPAEHLKGFRGLLQTDGYAGCVRFVESNPDVTHALCWSHARRKFFDIQAASKAPLAEEALRRIAGLYAIEIDLRGQSAEERPRVRQEQSRPLVEAMHAWMAKQLDRVPGRSAIAQAFRYALTHWKGLTLFLEDGS